MKKSCILFVLASTLLSLSAEPEIHEIAFASCFKETRPAPAMKAVADLKPDVFIWMGDNIYGDSPDAEVLREKYQVVRDHPEYARLREQAKVIGTWDDHDYGKNDAGKEFASKVAAQKELLDFLDEPAESPRRKQEGVYGYEDFGPVGKQVRVILLDTRYHRDPVGSDLEMLGEAQWQWLEEALVGSKAKVNIVVSSIQFLPEEHRFEKWAKFPKERARMLKLLARADVPPVIILSGDRHLAEISVDRESCGYPLYDITSSSLNLALGGGKDEANRFREGRNFRPANFGTLSFDWSRKVPVVTACIRDDEGVPQRAVSIELIRK